MDCTQVDQIQDNNFTTDRTSKFDKLLQKLWNERKLQGKLNYLVDEIPTKILGKHEFVVQANFKRGALRRKPDEIVSIDQPFNPDKFNFLKVSDDERLLFFNKYSKMQQTNGHGLGHQLIINNSPIEDCSSLLLPYIHQQLPQILTAEGINLATNILLLSNSKSFKVAFNSLGGNCSVNHQHFHMYYLRDKLYLETASLVKLIGPCWTVEDYPAKCFVFVMNDASEIEETIANTMRLVKFLVKENIAHNLFITRGVGTEPSKSGQNFSPLRFIIWARNFAAGVKDPFELVPASSELSGQVIIWTPSMYENIEERYIINLFQKSCDDKFKFVRSNLQLIFEH